MAQEKRKSRVIRDKEFLDYFFSLTERDLCKFSFMMENFGEFGDKKKYNTYDIIQVPPGTYGPEGKKNKNTFSTTLGIYIFNKVFIEPHLFDLFGYINKPITKKVYSKLNQKIAYALLEDKISLDDMKDYHLKYQKFQPYSNILSPSFSEEMLLSSDKINKKKEELIKKYKKELDNNDIRAVDSIQKELLDYSDKLLKYDKAMDMYHSGAKASVENNFKNLFLLKGAIKDPEPGAPFSIVTSNYMDGISKDDYVAIARSLAAGPYSRGKKTMIGGYWEKLFLRSFQQLILDDNNKDCGTKRTIEVVLTEKMANLLMYSYMVEGNKLVELTSENRDKYIGKKVKFRFSSLCESSKGICHVCAGNFFHRLGIKNVGVTTPQVASKLKLISMKAFHDSQIKLYDVDVSEVFGLD